MKKSVLLMALLLGLTACGTSSGSKEEPRPEIDWSSLEDNNYHPTPENQEPLGEFNLVSPVDHKVMNTLETFVWQESENADKYTLEICSSPSFVRDNENIDYYSRENINATNWTIGSTLAYGNTNYYWRVTAYNGTGSVESTSTFSFFIVAQEADEVLFDLGDADDWQLHPTGSYADVFVDDNNFFDNGQESIGVQFKKEDTNQGIPTSDGWVIVTKTIEKSIYGTDGLYFKMFYAGQDANLVIRLVDRDNEYWFCNVKVSNNAKQEVILKFEDFVQRTADVTVANHTFDYERIKYFEIVFERSFGDGLFLISEVKAIKFANYQSLFIKKLDFSSYPEDMWTYENYTFEKDVSEDELTLKYYAKTTDDHKGLYNYGFAKINVNQFFDVGDSIKVSIKYTGGKGTKIYIRVYEEDKDRWRYAIPYSSLTENEYTTLVIPFAAFEKSGDFQGDGKRQFYRILNLQFGLEGYTSDGRTDGALSFKDFEIVSKSTYKPEESRYINSTGLIENFDEYKFSCESFLVWDLSEVNKDEYVALETANKVGGTANKQAGRIDYKSDMMPATYTIPINTDNNFSSLSVMLKDASVKSGDPRFGHVDNWSANTTIVINLITEEQYKFNFQALSTVWTEYHIPFSAFELRNADDIYHFPNEITPGGIVSISIELQYFYYDVFGNPLPQYTMNNPVYIDDLYLGHDTSYSSSEKEKTIVMKDGISDIDDFEKYHNDDDLKFFWIEDPNKAPDYRHIELSNDTSSKGGEHSMAMQYKSKNDSPSYYIAPVFDSGVKARAVSFDLRSDKPVTVYFNLYLNIGGNTKQVRITISNVSSDWTNYTYGLGSANTTIVSGAPYTFNANDLIYVYRISFGMTYSNDETATLGMVYLDNLKFDFNIDDYSYKSITKID